MRPPDITTAPGSGAPPEKLSGREAANGSDSTTPATPNRNAPHEHLTALHRRKLMLPDLPLNCGLCKPAGERTAGVCSKCVIVIQALDKRERRELYFRLDPDQRGLMKRVFVVDTAGDSDLRARRRAVGLSQAELAEKLDINQAFLSRVERGEKQLSERLRERLQKLRI